LSVGYEAIENDAAGREDADDASGAPPSASRETPIAELGGPTMDGRQRCATAPVVLGGRHDSGEVVGCDGMAVRVDFDVPLHPFPEHVEQCVDRSAEMPAQSVIAADRNGTEQSAEQVEHHERASSPISAQFHAPAFWPTLCFPMKYGGKGFGGTLRESDCYPLEFR